MNQRIKWSLALIFAIGAGAYLVQPRGVPPDFLDGLQPDPAHGALVFAAMGCASCHMAAENGQADLLAGGRRFVTDFGVFVAPNISSDRVHGIGGWRDIDIASAIVKGTSPSGQHYFPAFPYSSYAKATPQDIADLIAHLRALPADPRPRTPHDLRFPFDQRALLGGWKAMFVKPGWVITGDLNDQQMRGRYLVEALGHCGECHTPRNALGGLQRDAWLTGAANPSGEGRIPGITMDQLGWTDGEIAEYLHTGFTPDFDSAGGAMAEVIDNVSQLPDADIAAIVAYLGLVPTPSGTN